MALLILVIFGAVLLWLKIYTNHGQKLELPDYKSQHIKEATADAETKSFQIVIKDSTHKVGVPGGLILDQNPKPGALVKENRKIYVDVSKYNPDIILLDDMRPMYGREFNNKRKELASLQINCKIIDRKHDLGEPNHILEVWYNGKLVDGRNGRTKGVEIKVGSTLEFVVSGLEGGQTDLIDYRCRTLKDVKWIFDQSRLKIGTIEKRGIVTDMEQAVIIDQDPSFQEGQKISMGSRINLVVQQERPEDCR